jgi:hypothetical protein
VRRTTAYAWSVRYLFFLTVRRNRRARKDFGDNRLDAGNAQPACYPRSGADTAIDVAGLGKCIACTGDFGNAETLNGPTSGSVLTLRRSRELLQ